MAILQSVQSQTTSHRPELYMVWQGMKCRCYNKNHPTYVRYGARGITICDQWRHSFKKFEADIGPRPSRKHTIDRIDNNGNYEPGNCRWSTRYENTRNRSCTRLIEFDGKEMTISEWARHLGIRVHSLFNRFQRGWTIERALTQPLQKKNKAKK